ncbi:glycosyltransferase [Neobacillus cucumis]|uniref:glycosyltransferase n=1 Tax=Neobacillus cucumis TaxID=1740721 RepID=UPI00203BBB6E|nr:glycosyltransferase [Neobacillus cucumis]MCM3727698.1 glycosyltransferase [Neobacillus cucumis]
MKSKLAFLLPSFEEGGVEKVTINLAYGLRSMGYDVEFVVFKKQGAFLSEVEKEFTIHELKINRSSESIFKLVTYFKQNRPDFFISAKHYINTNVLIAKLLSRTKTKIIVSGHGMFFKRRGLLPFLMKVTYTKADAIVAVSNGVGKNISEITNISADKITVIHNPVISEEFIQTYQQTNAYVKPDGYKLILSIGRLSPEKDYTTLIKAFHKVREHHPVKLMIVGEGPERDKLQETINELNLNEDVALPGFKKNPIGYLKAADLFVLSSLTEGLPTVLIESLYCKTPIVSTDCPSGPDEILCNGEYGKLTPVGDAGQLAEAIEHSLLQAETDVTRLRDRALDFTSEKATKKYDLLINSLM